MFDRFLKGCTIAMVLVIIYLGYDGCHSVREPDRQTQQLIDSAHKYLDSLHGYVKSNAQKDLLIQQKNLQLEDSSAKIQMIVKEKDQRYNELKTRLKPLLKIPITNDTIALIVQALEICDSLHELAQAQHTIDHQRLDNDSARLAIKDQSIDTLGKAIAHIQDIYEPKLKADAKVIRKLVIKNTVLTITGAILAIAFLVK